jgi:hypothetical protein
MEPNIEKVKERAQKAMGQAADRASVRAKSAVDIVAHETHTLAGALRGAAEQAERDGARVVHEPLRRMADFCEQLAGRAGEQNPRQLFTGLTELGRREPLMLFGAATAVAVLSKRAMRSATTTRMHDDGRAPSTEGAASATFTPPEASMPPLESPPPDRDVAITASTTGGMSEDQAETSRETVDTRDAPGMER